MSADKPQDTITPDAETAEQPAENTEESQEEAPESSESVSQPAEHTVESGEIQAKDAGAEGDSQEEDPEPTTLLGRLEKKYDKVDSEMDEIERLVLSTVDRDVPEPYHVSWQEEVNRYFSLAVRIKNRRDRERKREKDAS